MKKIHACYLLFVVFLVSGCYTNHIQGVKEFHIQTPENKVTESYYNHLLFIDSRSNTKNLGIMRFGMFNRLKVIINSSAFSSQFKQIFDSTIDEFAHTDTLVLQLRELFFEQFTSNIDLAQCRFRVSLYKYKNLLYYPIQTIDTLIDDRNKILFGNRDLMSRVSEVIGNIIVQSLYQSPLNDSLCYTKQQVDDIEHIEKKKIPLYTQNSLTDGIYFSYNSFKMQEPNAPFNAEFTRKKEIDYLLVKDKNNNLKPIAFNKVFAVVWNGNAYVTVGRKLFKLFKQDDDFYFDGYALSHTQELHFNNSSYFDDGTISLGRYLVTNNPFSYNRQTYLQKIDHLSGNFIKIFNHAKLQPIKPLYKN